MNSYDCREDGRGEDVREGYVPGDCLGVCVKDGLGPVAKSTNDEGTEVIPDSVFEFLVAYACADKLGNTCSDIRFHVLTCAKMKSCLCHSSTSQSVRW